MGTTVLVASILDEGQVFQEKRTPGCVAWVSLCDTACPKTTSRGQHTISLLDIVKVRVHG